MKSSEVIAGMEKSLVATVVSDFNSALLSFKAGGSAVIIDKEMTLEELRLIKGTGLVLLKSKETEKLTQKVQDYLEVTENQNYIVVKPEEYNGENAYWSTKVEVLKAQGADKSLLNWAEDQRLCTLRKSELIVGSVEKILRNRAVIKFTKPVALRDKLKINETEFEVANIDQGLSFIPENTVSEIDFPQLEDKPKFGTKVICTFRHNAKLSEDLEKRQPYKQKIKIKITIEDKKILINDQIFETEVQASKSQADLGQRIMEVFLSSGDSFYVADKVSFENKSSFDFPFVPLSELKSIKKVFYKTLDLQLSGE